MISQNDEKVKGARKKARAAANRAARAADAAQPPVARWQLHKSDTVRMAGRMLACGYNKRAERMLMCGNELIFDRCPDCGYITLKRAYLCRDRLCPTCAWRLSIKRYAAMQQILAVSFAKYPDDTFALVTLTCDNTSAASLRDYLALMQRAWQAIIYQRWVRARVRGWAKSLEITYSVHLGTLHPHYHVLVQAPMLKIAEGIIDEWLSQCARLGIRAVRAAQNIQEVRRSNAAGDSLAGAVCEVYKYMVKSSDTLSMPLAILRDLASGVSGKRLISMGGCLKQIARDLKIDNLDEPDEADSEDTRMCTKCGSQMVDELALRWSCEGGRYLAFKSVDADDVQAVIDAAIDGRLQTDDNA